MTAKSQKMKKETDIEKIVEQALQKVLHFGIERGKCAAKEAFRKTESRLYAYPVLLDNIEQYKKDIEDLLREKPGRSKDLVFYSTSGGSRLTDDEIQEGRILIVRKKIERDQTEIDEINYALEVVKEDEYYPLLTKKYFESKKDDEIAEDFSCDARTIRRNKSRLIRKIAIKLYGAEAVG
ncbi:hypothetical protein [Sporomusa aerivorans]|uniref:hypothetical protein n=1 Tax=Sporomusa aerivorans TaxID=204936 RepID=UPI00352A6BA8